MTKAKVGVFEFPKEKGTLLGSFALSHLEVVIRFQATAQPIWRMQLHNVAENSDWRRWVTDERKSG
ncbi:MAG: hypothetical protein ACK40X_02580 [Armatimonadota bacterium]